MQWPKAPVTTRSQPCMSTLAKSASTAEMSSVFVQSEMPAVTPWLPRCLISV